MADYLITEGDVPIPYTLLKVVFMQRYAIFNRFGSKQFFPVGFLIDILRARTKSSRP